MAYLVPPTRETAVDPGRMSSPPHADAARIHVMWYRSSDGQHGFLNPDENHAVTGVPWNPTMSTTMVDRTAHETVNGSETWGAYPRCPTSFFVEPITVGEPMAMTSRRTGTRNTG